MTSLYELRRLAEGFLPSDKKMPVLFIGHGSPMNALETNTFTESWKKLGNDLPKPSAILCISAHWLTRGSFVTMTTMPETIHDFGGFPDALFNVQYPAKGAPELAKEIIQQVKTVPIQEDLEWGLDHGTWSVLNQMYPKADIPVIQLSIDFYQKGRYHYELAKELAILRDKGVLIIGSGNIVHNLGLVDWNMGEKGFDWALEIDDLVKKQILASDHTLLINYHDMGNSARLAIPTPDHYYPLLYTLGMQEKNDKITLFNDQPLMGSLTMTSVMLGEF